MGWSAVSARVWSYLSECLPGKCMLQASSSLVYRRSVGDFSVLQLSDGVLEHRPAQAFFGLNVDTASFEALSAANGLSTDVFDFPATVTLIDTGSERILIDAGHGFARRPNAGHLLRALAEAGVTPDSISHVLLTHLHRDHVGGLLGRSGDLVFANARHWMSPLEQAYWTGPGSNTPVGIGARELIDKLNEKLSFITPGEELVQGVSAVDSGGHTPGHLCVLIQSQKKRLLVAGDVANHPFWSIAHPDWHMSLDVDPAEAARSRQKVLGWLADEKVLMAGYHMPFPALGTVERDGEDFHYVSEVS